MNAQERSLPWPAQGRDDAFAAPGQPMTTTPEASNVRTRNPRTGRHGGAARGGLDRYCSTALGASGPRAMADIVVDTRSSNFEELDTPTIAWSASGPTGRETRAVRVDNDGNSYSLEGGTHVVVRNAGGVQTDSIALPVQSSGQRCYALEIDPSSRTFYVGASEGGSQARALLWCYVQDPYLGWQVVWQLEPDAYVAKLFLHNGVLHAGLDDTLRGRSYVVAYTNIQNLGVEAWRAQVPFPVTGLQLSSTGRIAVCSGYNADRGLDPRYPGAGQVLDETFRSWWIDNIGGWSTRKWCVFDPADLGLSTGDGVFNWNDSEGSDRTFAATGETVTLAERYGTLVFAANPSDGHTFTVARRDGTISETWTFRTTPTVAYEVDIGADLAVTLVNLTTVINNGTSLSPGSVLVYISSLTRIRPLAGAATEPQDEITFLSSNSNLQFRQEPGGTALFLNGLLRAASTVVTTAPTFRSEAMSGRPMLRFDGKSSLLVAPINPTIDVAAADSMTALIPGYGANGALASSARWAVFVVCRPDPSYAGSTMLSQQFATSAGALFRRAICSNMGTDGLYSNGKITAVDRNNTGPAVRYHAATPSGTSGVANFSLISWVSNPDGAGGLYEVYYNGSEMDNVVPDHTGTASASDSLSTTRLGQTSFVPVSGFSPMEQFWAGDVGIMIAVQHSSSAPITVAERQLIEGALAWYYGAQNALPNTHPYYSTPPPAPDGTVADFHLARRALSPYPNVTALDGQSRDIAWLAASPETGVGTTSGLGTGIAWLSDGNLVSMGVPANPAEDLAAVRKIIDQTDDYSVSTADGAWSWDIGSSSEDKWSADGLEMAIDQFDNIYVPWLSETTTIDGAPPQFVMFDEDGVVVLQPDAERAQACYSIALHKPQPVFNDEDIDRQSALVLGLRMDPSSTMTMTLLPADGDQINFSGTVSGAPVVEVYTFVTALASANDVLIGATVIETLENLADAINHGPGESTTYGAGTTRSVLVSAMTAALASLEIVARRVDTDTIATSSTLVVTFDPANPEVMAAPTETLTKYDLVGLVAELGEGRLRQRVAVVDRNIVVFGSDYVQVTTGGSTVTDADARYWHSVALGRHVFTTDGVNAWATDVRTRETALYKATSAGNVPPATPILEAFRARIVALVGSRAHYSATGDAFNWDYDPGVRQPSQAWSTGLPPSFDIDDVLNGFAPINDDLALIMGDHTLWRLTGDPGPGGNGQYDVLTRSIGGAFGRAWCMGPTGEMYLWTNEGELMALIGGSELRPISGARMREVCRAIDLRTNFIRMAWNTAAGELDIFACPYGGETGEGRWLSWEASVDAWWENEFTGRVVTDAIEVNGDSPSDGLVVAGFSDGWVRGLTQSSTDDDGTPIHSLVRIGPLSGGDARLDLLLTELQVMLDATGDGCLVEVWGSETARDFGRARWRRTLLPGVSGVMLSRVRANFVWVVLRGTGAWGFEQMSAFVEAGGLRRRSRV